MLKRNFDNSPNNPSESQHEGEPQAKRPHSASLQNTVRVPSPKDSHSLKSYPVLSEMLDKAPKEKRNLFDNVLEYFDRQLGDLCASKKAGSSGITNTGDVDLPQMITNPKACVKANMIGNPPDVIPVSEQKLRSPPKYQRPRTISSNVTPLDGPVNADRESNVPTLVQKPKPECCIVEHLIKRFQHFGISVLSGETLLVLINKGRPTPAIPRMGVTKTLYEHHPWVTGCPTLGKLYCWTCLLFVRERTTTLSALWTEEGFSCMNVLRSAVTIHTNSVAHKSAVENQEKFLERGLVPNLSPGAQVQNEPKTIPCEPNHRFVETRRPCLDQVKQTPMPKTLPDPMIPNVRRVVPLTQAADLRANNQKQNAAEEIYDLTADDSETPPSWMFDAWKGSLKERMKVDTENQALLIHQQKNVRTPETPHSALETNPSPKTTAETESQSTPDIINISALQLEYFPNGRFTGTEAVRRQIVAIGRPTPELPGLVMALSKKSVECFSKSYYRTFPWLCGSREMNRLYCWPCLVFNDHPYNNTWNTVGINTLANLQSAARAHSLTQTHLELSLRLKMVEQCLKTTQPEHRAKDEGTIRRKQLLIYLIDAVCFKKKQLNNVDVSHDDIHDFLKILGAYDMKLNTLLDPESKNYVADFVPKFAASPEFLADVTKALTIILRRKIAAEVSNAVYVSFILRRVKNNHVALIVRYVEPTAVVRERFYHLFQIGFGLQEPLLKLIFTEIDALKCSSKFVGISYDGGLLRPDQMESFNSKMRSSLMAAYFFHYTDDDFYALLQQTMSYSPQCRSFLQLVTEFERFLKENPKIQRAIGPLKSSDSDIFVTILLRYSTIMQYLTQVANGSSASKWSNHVVSQCEKFSKFFGTAETRVLLVLFSKARPCIQRVSLHPPYKSPQGAFDAEHWKCSASAASHTIRAMKACGFEGTFKSAENLAGGTELAVSTEDKTRLVTMLNDTTELILTFIKSRTKYIDVWSYFDFSNKNVDGPIAQAETHQAQFLIALKECFPLFDAYKLCSALIFAYKDPRFRDKSPSEVARLMIKWDFNSVLPELFKYVLLIQAVPLSSAHVSDPISGRLAAYVEGKTKLTLEDALLYLEKDLLASARNEGNFYDEVFNIISER